MEHGSWVLSGFLLCTLLSFLCVLLARSSPPLAAFPSSHAAPSRALLGRRLQQLLGSVKAFEVEIDQSLPSTTQAPMPAGIQGGWVQQRQFTIQGNTGFVSYSAYHLGQQFVALNGLTLTSAAEQYQHPRFQEDTVCQWIVPRAWTGQKEELAGNVILEGSPYAMVDPLAIMHNRGPCAQTVIYCEFEDSAYARALLRSVEGLLHVRMGKGSFAAAPENKKLLDKDADESTLPQFLAFCSPPIFGTLEPRSILEWVAFHQYHIGFDHLYFYDGGAFTQDLFRGLRRYMDRGTLTVHNFKEIPGHESWARSQVLAMHDCMHLARESATWVAFGDMDEYLVAERLPPPALNFKHFLKLNGAGYAEVSRGSVHFKLVCPGAEPREWTGRRKKIMLWQALQSEFIAEVLLWRAKEPECIASTSQPYDGDPGLCPGWRGRRKPIINPRRALMLDVHTNWLLLPPILNHTKHPLLRDPKADTALAIYMLPARDVYNAHYQGCSRETVECGEALSAKAIENGDFVQTDVVAKIAAEARKCSTMKSRTQAECNYETGP